MTLSIRSSPQLLATMASLAPRFLAQHFAADVWPAVRALLLWRGDDGDAHTTGHSPIHSQRHSHNHSLSQSQSQLLSHKHERGSDAHPYSDTESETETEAARQRALVASPSLQIRAAALRCLTVVVQVLTLCWFLSPILVQQSDFIDLYW